MSIVRNLGKLVNKGITAAGNNSPALLAGAAVAGVISTIAVTYKNAPKAKEILESYQSEIEAEVNSRDLTDDQAKEKTKKIRANYFKQLAPVIAPTIIFGGLTIACIIGGTRVSLRRQAALTAAYNLSENAFNDWHAKAKEVVGEEKVKEIDEKVASDKVLATPLPEKLTVEDNDVLCLEPTQQKYISSNMDKLKALESNINLMLLKWDVCTLNELYDQLELPTTSIGDDIGWSTRRNEDRSVDIRVTPAVSKDEKPCFVITYDPMPHPLV